MGKSYGDVVYVFTETKTVELPSGKTKRVPAGRAHMAMLTYDGRRMLCNQSYLGGSLEAQTLPKDTDVCPDCAKAWKELPNGPWRAWVEGRKQVETHLHEGG